MTETERLTSTAAEAPTLGLFSLTRKEFASISELARREFGVELGAGKEQLVAARIGKLMRKLRFSTFEGFCRHLEVDRTGECLTQLIDSLTTNHTSFFREQAHFDFLVGRIFRDRVTKGPILIWSAACSTGEEPYTIALIAQEYFGSRDREIPRILASDISTHVLDTARRATYPAQRFGPTLAPWLHKYLLRGEGRSEGLYRMRPEIVDMVEFRRINLIEPLPELGHFDVIFCRNVMIYFSHQTQAQLVHRLSACLKPGGYLFVGHSETLTGIQHGLEHIQPAIYRKRGTQK